MPVTSASTASTARALFCVLVSWLVTAGGLSRPLKVASLAGPKKRKRSSRERKQQQGLSCAIQPVDFSQRSRGFKLRWFQMSCLDIERCKSWLVMAGFFFQSFCMCLFLAGSEERKKSSRESKQQQGLSCAIQPVDFSQRSRGFKLRWFQMSCLDIERCKSWLVMAGIFFQSFCMCLFWQAPKNEKQVPKKVSSSKACLVQFSLWTSDSEAEGLICVGFRGIEGCKSKLVIAGGLSHPFALALLEGPEE